MDQYLIVQLHSFSIITLCLCLQGCERYWLCANLATKDSPDHIIISQGPVKSTEENESVTDEAVSMINKRVLQFDLTWQGGSIFLCQVAALVCLVLVLKEVLLMFQCHEANSPPATGCPWAAADWRDSWHWRKPAQHREGPYDDNSCPAMYKMCLHQGY